MSKFQIVPSEGEDEDDATKAFNEEYVKREDVGKEFFTLPKSVQSNVKVKILSGFENSLKKHLGEEFIEGDTKANIDKLIELSEEKVNNLTKEIEDARKGNPDVSEKLTALEKTIEHQKSIIQKHKDELKAAQEAVENSHKALTEKENSWIVEKYKESKTSNALVSLKTIIPDEKEYGIYKTYYESKLSEYNVILDENKNPYPVDKDGNIIHSRKAKGEKAHLDELSDLIMEEISEIRKTNSTGRVDRREQSERRKEVLNRETLQYER